MSACVIWPGYRRRDGYGILHVKGCKILAHRAMFEAFTGKRLRDVDVLLHSCDNPSCVNPDHLRAGTQADNVADCKEKGRQSRGEKRWSAKITEAVAAMVRLEKSELTQREIGVKYGLSQSQIHRILTNKNWKV